jgi:hypothetical protein
MSLVDGEVKERRVEISDGGLFEKAEGGDVTYGLGLRYVSGLEGYGQESYDRM